jgi:hypothetical protein
MHVREDVDSASTILELTTENERITLGGAAGTVTLNVSASTMAGIAAGKYVYDLEVVAPVSGVVNRLIQGNFVVRPEVTR